MPGVFWSEYLAAHARRLYTAVTDAARVAAALLATRLARGRLALGVMKPRYAYLVLALGLVVVGYVVMRVQNYHEARSWNIEVKVRAPVYESSSYPYGSQSPPNAIVGYIEVGSKPDVRGMEYGKDWPMALSAPLLRIPG